VWCVLTSRVHLIIKDFINPPVPPERTERGPSDLFVDELLNYLFRHDNKYWDYGIYRERGNSSVSRSLSPPQTSTGQHKPMNDILHHQCVSSHVRRGHDVSQRHLPHWGKPEKDK
jgi:hypothetical protein